MFSFNGLRIKSIYISCSCYEQLNVFYIIHFYVIIFTITEYSMKWFWLLRINLKHTKYSETLI